MKKIMALTIAGAIAVFSASSVFANGSSPACKNGAMANMNDAASKAQDKHQDHQKMDGMTPKTKPQNSAKKPTAMKMNKKSAAAQKKGMNMKKKSTQKKPVEKKSDMKDMNMKDMDMDEMDM
jgi:hypothetical protein